jgi:thymidine phosphorylase
MICAIDARLIGVAVVGLGGGRTRAGEAVDPSVGFAGLAPLGAAVGPGSRPLGTVLARTGAAADVAAALLRRACQVGDAPPLDHHPVIERIDSTTLDDRA